MPNGAGRKWERSSEALVEKFLKIFEGYEDIERKKMFGYACCFLKSYMFTGLHEQNWILRLGEADREQMIDCHGATLFEPMEGRPMREYVLLPKAILADDEALHEWIEKSMQFVRSLPPKKPKKKKVKVAR